MEKLIWFLIVKEALTIEGFNLLVAFAYAIGFGLGTYIGIWLSEKLTFGNVSLQVIIKDNDNNLVEAMRKAGYAVSTVITHGKEGENLLLIIALKRKALKSALAIIYEKYPKAFVSMLDNKAIVGGYFGD